MSKQPLMPPFEKKVHLKDYDPAYTGSYEDESEVQEQLNKDLDRLRDLQEVLYAERKRTVLIVLQGIDTGGKDGTIGHVFRGLNPQGVEITAFKQPSAEELSHDFLWRVHHRVPPQGMIGVFNRSHYEDVLVVRVHDLVPKKVWKARYEIINHFEEMLVEQDVVILKFFLYISKDEQKERLQSRIDNPHKQWKFALGDLKERELWDDYVEAYEDMLTKCNTETAPWYIVPANHKWYRDLVVTRTIVEALDKLNLKYPKPVEGLENVVIPD
ncbi:MAG: polyphosphate kinase 2 family protein [Chloroflexota bacterium]